MVEIGSQCLDRLAWMSTGTTVIDMKNPSTQTGIITNACAYIHNVAGGTIKVKTFDFLGNRTFSLTGDTGTIPVVAGMNNITGLTLPINIGGYIGCYAATTSPDVTVGLTDPATIIDPPVALYEYVGDVTVIGTVITGLGYSSNRAVSVHGTITVPCQNLTCSLEIQ